MKISPGMTAVGDQDIISFVPDRDLPYKVAVEAYGVRCIVRTNKTTIRNRIKRTLTRYIPGCEFDRKNKETMHVFDLQVDRSDTATLKDRDGEILGRASTGIIFEIMGSKVRLTIAEFAPEHVFIHAGVVGWKGRAVLFPARSFQGKSALTSELIKIGARYYSDEYAVIDKRGKVHPFPKDLSLRGIRNDFDQVEYSASKLGAAIGKRSIPIGLVLFTEFKAGARWSPKPLNSGKGLLELINNCVSIRQNPKFVIPILSKAVAAAKFLKTKRGEAKEAAPQILELLK